MNETVIPLELDVAPVNGNKPTKGATQKTPSNDLDLALGIFKKHIEKERKATVNRGEVKAMIEEHLKSSPIMKVESFKGELKTVDGLSPEFKTVLGLAYLKNNVYLYGPAGSGKTHTAIKAAETLDLDFYVETGLNIDNFRLFGGNSPIDGKYHETAFYRAFKNGGLFLLDEMDRAEPEVLISFNTAIEQGKALFGSEMVERHPDFILIGAGNTKLNGNENGYFANVQDHSVKSRFVYVELKLSDGQELNRFEKPEHIELVKHIQRIRREADKLGISSGIDFRAMRNACKLWDVKEQMDLGKHDILALTVYNKLPDNEAQRIRANVNKS